MTRLDQTRERAAQASRLARWTSHYECTLLLEIVAKADEFFATYPFMAAEPRPEEKPPPLGILTPSRCNVVIFSRLRDLETGIDNNTLWELAQKHSGVTVPRPGMWVDVAQLAAALAEHKATTFEDPPC